MQRRIGFYVPVLALIALLPMTSQIFGDNPQRAPGIMDQELITEYPTFRYSPKDGDRAICVTLTVEGIGRAIPGSRVDVWASVKLEGQEGASEKLLGEDVLVLAIYPKSKRRSAVGLLVTPVTPEIVHGILEAAKCGGTHLAMHAPTNE